MKNNNILITICARGGSKGLPGKHLKIFHEEPLIIWTLHQALDFGNSDIIVSSDDSKILHKIRHTHIIAPIIVHKRPKKLSNDSTPKLDVIRDALKTCERKTKKQYPIVIDLDATNPLRTTDDIQACVDLFKLRKPNTIVSVVKSRRSPYFNMVEVINGKVKLCKQLSDVCMVGPGWSLQAYRRQDVPYTYDLNCSIYVYDRNWLLNEQNKSPIGEKTELYVMSDETFCDIDTELDFRIAEYLSK